MSKSTCLTTQVCGFEPAKMVAFLRKKYPHDTAKNVAAALDESPRNVENWLAHRSCPSFGKVGVMIAKWGVEFIVAVMADPPEWAVDALAREEFAELGRRSAALKSRLGPLVKD